MRKDNLYMSYVGLLLIIGMLILMTTDMSSQKYPAAKGSRVRANNDAAKLAAAQAKIFGEVNNTVQKQQAVKKKVAALTVENKKLDARNDKLEAKVKQQAAVIADLKDDVAAPSRIDTVIMKVTQRRNLFGRVRSDTTYTKKK